MKPHKHAELIKLWADGNKIQWRGSNNDMEWMDIAPIWWDEDKEYRVKPAAPKWPQTTMTNKEINGAIANGPLELISFGATETARRVINKAIEHECGTGALVPADKVCEIEAKARVEGKREGLHPVAVIQAVVNHMLLDNIDADTVQIILLKAAEL